MTKATSKSIRRRRRIGQILVEAGMITREQLDEALDGGEGLPLGRKLVNLGYLTEEDIAVVLAKQMNLPYLELSDFDINVEAASMLSDSLARKYKVLPVEVENNNLIVAMADPTNIFALDDLRIMTGYDISPVVVTETELMEFIDKLCTTDEMVEEAVESLDEVEEAVTTAADDEEKGAKEAPVVKLVNLLITQAVRDRANDIHIEPQEKDVRVRYRIDGVLHEVMRSPKKAHTGVVSRIKIMAGLDIAERRLPQDGRFGLLIDSKPIDFRVATLPTIYGEKVVLRVLEKESILMQLNDLGFLPDSLERFRSSFGKPYGAVFVTGPTGSGKTTTLYAALNILNSQEKNLITVEDPVEYRLASVNQVQVNTRTGLTFGASLRSILRHDPDIVMVGEIRDRETAQIAVEAALTGHLVLSTLHTNDAPSALVRLTEMGVEPFLISSAVDCVVSQRLARRLCSRCKEPHEPPADLIEQTGLQMEPGQTIYRAKGCKTCSETGYKGRVGLYEVMQVNESIERLVVDRAPSELMYKEAVKGGMVSVRHDGLEKIKQGLTSIDEVLRVTL